MHMIDPNAIKLNKIKFEAKTEIDYIANFKLVQNVFNKNHVNKVSSVILYIRTKIF